VAVIADQKNGLGGDFVVDARAVLGGRRCVTLKTSGDYDSLLLLPDNIARRAGKFSIPAREFA
jgi:hypothetical protein